MHISELQKEDRIVTRPSFIDGSLAYPGQPVSVYPNHSVDADGEVTIHEPKWSDNLAPATEAMMTPIRSPSGAIGPHADSATVPQGVPPGAMNIQGRWFTFTPGEPPIEHVVSTNASDLGLRAATVAAANQANANQDKVDAEAEARAAAAKANGDREADGIVAPGGAAEGASLATMTKDQLVAWHQANDAPLPTGSNPTKAALVESAEAHNAKLEKEQP